MSNRNRVKVLLLLLLAALPSLLFALSGEEIIRKMDEQSTFETSYSTGTLTTTDRFATKESTFKAWSRGSAESLIEFTSIAERGQKILRTRGSLYLYYPDAEQLIRLQGAALRQSVLGSDLSYEDMTEEKNTLDNYKVVLNGNEMIGTRECYVLTLTATNRQVAYPVQKLWVDQETYLVWKAEYSTAQGRLLKEMEVLRTIDVAERTLPSETRIEDKMKRGSTTWMMLDTLEVDIPLDRNLFSLENLTW